MFRNYIKTALRNLWRYKGFSAINLASLSIGIIGCLVIGLFVHDELQYDKSIPSGENIYRIYNIRTENGVETKQAPVAPAYTTFLLNNYPEVDTAARILMSDDKFLLETTAKSAYESKGWYVDNSFLSVFPMKFLAGDRSTALAAPASIVISEAMAHKYFGTIDVIGKTIKLEKEDFAVRGVLAKLPEHFHLDFNYLISLSNAGIAPERMERWTWGQFFTYVKLKPGTDPKAVESKFQAHVIKTVHPTSTT